MAVVDVFFYNTNPRGTFSETIGGTTTYAGPATADGFATITDTQTGAEELSLDDDNASENATADVSIGGLTSTGSNVDNEASWTVRDTVTGEIFQIAEFEVEQGGAAGTYLLSERPLVPGRTYETLEFEAIPDVTANDPVFTYAQQVGFESDQIVSGTAGDDVINTSYTGDNDGDQIDNLDNIELVDSTDEIFSWVAFGANGTNLEGDNSQTLGGVNVSVTVTDEGDLGEATVSTGGQYVGTDPYDVNSALRLTGTGSDSGNLEDTTSLTIDFSAEDGSGKANEVIDVNFRINEIDFGTWQDVVTITAIGADGSLIPVTITVDGNDSLSGNTVTGEATNDAATDQNSSIKIEIAGPVRQIIVDYDNAGTGGQLLNVTDIHFTTQNAVGNNNDSVEAGAGNDFIDPSVGMDTVDGGTGNDTIVASLGDDTLLGGDDQDTFQLDDNFGTDVVTGGEGGSDNDILDASNLTSGVDVTFTGDEAGTLTDGTSTANFTEIEDFVLTGLDDSLDGTAASTAIEVDAGAGNDTILGGTGNDTFNGGTGDDSLVGGAGADSLVGAAGADTLLGGTGSDTLSGGADNDLLNGGTGNDFLTGGLGDDTIQLGDGFGTDQIQGSSDPGNGDVDVIDASALTSGINVTMSGPEFGTLTNGANSATFSEIEGFVFTDFADTFDASGSTASYTIDTGAGNDTLIGGTGDDTFTGGLGNDTFVYTASGGMDVITDFGAGESGPINDGDQTNNDFIDLSSFYTPAALAAYNASNGGLADLVTELALLRADAEDGVLDGIINGVDISADTGDINLTLENGGSPVTGSALRFDNTNVVCFAKGTLIRTAAGNRRIECLRTGDFVFTKDNGLQRIRWIGSKTVAAKGKLAPVVITAGVLGNRRDLKVSPQHRMLVTGDKAERLFGEREVLVPAKHLTNWAGIYQQECEEITYFHILFETHEIVFAEGAASESFHPGEFGMSTLEEAARDEILELFPELKTNARAFGPAARRSLRKGEAQLL